MSPSLLELRLQRLSWVSGTQVALGARSPGVQLRVGLEGLAWHTGTQGLPLPLRGESP